MIYIGLSDESLLSNGTDVAGKMERFVDILMGSRSINEVAVMAVEMLEMLAARCHFGSSTLTHLSFSSMHALDTE